MPVLDGKEPGPLLEVLICFRCTDIALEVLAFLLGWCSHYSNRTTGTAELTHAPHMLAKNLKKRALGKDVMQCEVLNGHIEGCSAVENVQRVHLNRAAGLKGRRGQMHRR